ALDMRLLGANPTPQMVGREELPGKVNYYQGNDPSRWLAGISTYARVEYQEVYPGINLVYYGNQQQLEYDFTIAPGADPSKIVLSYPGADQLLIDAHGDLVLRTSAGELREQRPYLYQMVDGVPREVSGGFVLSAGNQVRFQVGGYDPG